MMSKELAFKLYPQSKCKKFLEIKELKGVPYSENVICISYKLLNEEGEHIGYTQDGANAYEIANKCKEWAFNKGYSIYSGKKPDGQFFFSVSVVMIAEKNIFSLIKFRLVDNYLEGVFKAAEWILKKESPDG
ncbi:MAG: hypothetical protein COA44_06055 [Arcobacter sp.]|nr:MAG: hypothetical protein COA44_06055 [Arcobacter sp.]